MRQLFVGAERQQFAIAVGSLSTAFKRARSAAGRLARGQPRRDYVEGPPEGLPQQALELVARQHFGPVALARTRHEHLSGWKRKGAFRVHLDADNGSKWSVVFKDACYDRDEIPALDGLPQTPGPPEYLIHTARGDDLLSYLPEVYHCHEISPGSRYLYLFEDLSRRHVRLRQPRLALVVSQELPAIHAALESGMQGGAGLGFLRFDEEFSHALLEYAASALHQFASTRALPQLDSVLSAWDRLERFYERGLVSTYELVELRLIHGDLNPTNIWADHNDPRRLRLVDWEWAGLGIPHADLVSICEGAPEIEREAVRRYNRAAGARSLDEDYGIFTWCKLQRYLLNAAYCSRQALEGPAVETRFDLGRSVERSLTSIELILDAAADA